MGLFSFLFATSPAKIDQLKGSIASHKRNIEIIKINMARVRNNTSLSPKAKKQSLDAWRKQIASAKYQITKLKEELAAAKKYAKKK